MNDVVNTKAIYDCWNSRLKDLMAKRGLTQKRFAEMLYAASGVKFTQKQISNWLHIADSQSESSQKSLPTYENMKLIAQFFQCDVGYLTGETDAQTFDHKKASDFLHLSLETIYSIKKATDEETAFRTVQTTGSHAAYLYDKLLTSQYFHDFIIHLDELDHYYNAPSKAKKKLDEIDKTIDPAIRDEVYELVQRGLDEDDPMPREDVLNLYHEINTAIDDSCVEDENREYDIDVFKYRLLRAYNKLVDYLYPE